MPKSEYDFKGVATAYEVPCSDGRIIEHGAFDWQDGEHIPLVWRHRHRQHDDFIKNVVGHVVLQKSEDPSGMRALAKLNNTKEGQRAKELIHNRDVRFLSIWANELQEKNDGKYLRVKKGTIRDVSLVLLGGNPGAVIEEVIVHSQDPLDEGELVVDGVIIHTGLEIEFEDDETDEAELEVVEHEAETGTIASVLENLSEEKRKAFNFILHSASQGETNPAAETSGSDEGPTVQEVVDSMTDEEQTVLFYLAGKISPAENLSQEGDTDMPTVKHNIFENKEGGADPVLAHENLRAALKEAAETRSSSLKNVFKERNIGPQDILALYPNSPELSYLAHSITDISNFFPNARAVEPGGPQFWAREMEWVQMVLGGVRRTPFARIKSSYADLTGDAARAKGYVTGDLKVEEVITAFQRETLPKTAYKLQKLDRDNILDITEFNVVAWLKEEMKMMLQEEVARAILISDGRPSVGDPEKISETNIRPIYNDVATYTVSAIYNDVGNEKDLSAFTDAELIVLIDWIAEQMMNYRGAGAPTFWCQPEVAVRFMLIRDANDQRLHRNESELAAALGVSKIVKVPPMSGMERTGVVNPTGLPAGTYDIATLGVIVNLRDYVVGMDKGGETTFFDGFDIDYNKYTYLYETRLSGALVNPSSAIAVELVTAKTA